MAITEKEGTPAGAVESPGPTSINDPEPAQQQANGEAGEATQVMVESPTTLTSRPRRSLRSAGRAAEDKIIRKTVRIITKRPQRKWDAERLLTDPKSPLGKANLRAILSNPMAWTCLDAQDREQILALCPDQRHILTEEGERGENGGPATRRPNMMSLMNDDSFRYDCAAYTENLAQGRHDPDWLAQAWAAHERRKAGDFDDFLRHKFERDWEVQLPVEPIPDETNDLQHNEAAEQKTITVAADEELKK